MKNFKKTTFIICTLTVLLAASSIISIKTSEINAESSSETKTPETATMNSEKTHEVHTFELKETVNASCTKEGERIYICKDCGEEKEEIIAPSEHNYKIISSKAATCLEDGLEVYACEICKNQYSVTKNKTGHNYSFNDKLEWKHDTNYKYTCSNCGESYLEHFNVGKKYIDNLYIPSLSINIPVYFSHDQFQQAIVDAYDSASFNGREKDYIADHNNQNNFNNIKQAIPGKTIAYVGISKYVCVNNIQGKNNLYNITDADDNIISNYGGDLMLYTCNENWQNITITLWDYVE